MKYFLELSVFSQEKPNKMEWWREAKFGMFIHWGVYSVPAGYYHGQPGKLDVMIFNWPTDGKIELPGLVSKVTKAFLLYSHKALEFNQSDSAVTINLPSAAPDKIASVVCVEIADAVVKVTQ